MRPIREATEWSADDRNDDLSGLWGGGEASNGETPRMLAVVPGGQRAELTLLERARAIRDEHGARLIVVGTWSPGWQFCLAAAHANSASILVSLRDTSELRRRDFASRAGADVRLMVDCEQAGRAVDDELARGGYRYVVGRGSDLPRRLVRRWRVRYPGLCVIRF